MGKENLRLLVASSATGGHIYPALAIVAEIKARKPEAEILFVGGNKSIGRDVVGAAGYELVRIDAEGLNRKNPIKAAQSLAAFGRASAQAKKIIKDFGPTVVLCTGGYVVPPVAREAKAAHIPVFLQEQNALPGLANRYAEGYADKVFLGFSEAAKYFRRKKKIIVSGNPVRREFAAASEKAAEARARLALKPQQKAVLLFGGSQGADELNFAGAALAAAFAEREDERALFFITGERMYKEIYDGLKAKLGEIPQNIHLLPYADSIWEYFAAADLIVSRAGALTVSEIAVSGRPSLLIPSPNVTRNHQLYNALALRNADAAVVLLEPDIKDGGLDSRIEKLFGDSIALAKMGEAARTLSQGNAAEKIADELLA